MKPVVLTVVIPCYNEEKTLAACVRQLLAIGDAGLRLEIIIVNDCSSDGSLRVAEDLAALDAFHIDPRGTIGLDVGCSTGGFTDCLLQRGATRIYAIDVGYGQFEWRLRKDSRVVLLERTNIRYVDRAAVPEPIDLAVIDVSFISLTLVLPPVVHLLNSSAMVVVLVKPQFEVGKGQVGRGGIVRDDAQREAVTEKVIACAAHLGLQVRGLLDSPVIGRKGNREILVGFAREIST